MNPTPPSTPSIAELRTWLVECAQQLTDFERTLAEAEDSQSKRTHLLVGLSTSPDERRERLRALSVRLGLISELLAAQTQGVALVLPEQQLFDLMLRASLDRLAGVVAALRPPTATDEAIERHLAGLPIELPLRPGS